MAGIIYDRIRLLCQKNGITITKLEATLGFSASSIKKWESSSSPSVDKVTKVANYFGVSVDYLLGLTNVETPISEILADKDIISLQRAREKMSTHDKERMMQILRIGFEHVFSDEESSGLK